MKHAIGYILAAIITGVFSVITTNISNDVSLLRNEIYELQMSYNKLETEHELLKNSYGSLEREYNELNIRYKTLEINYNELLKNGIASANIQPPAVSDNGLDVAPAMPALTGSVNLFDLHVIQQGSVKTVWGNLKDMKDSYGRHIYRNSQPIKKNSYYTLDLNDGFKEFLLDEKYSTLTGTLFISDETPTDNKGDITIVFYIDGREMHYEILNRQTEPYDININLLNNGIKGKILKIAFSCKNSDIVLGMADFKVIP